MNPIKMKNLFESISSINRDLKKLLSQEAINNFGKTTYQGDNANYSISLFQDQLIQPNENVKKFLYYMGKSLLNWCKSNLKDGYYPLEDVHHGTEIFLGFLPRYIDLFPDDDEAQNLILSVFKFIDNHSSSNVNWFDYEKNNFKSWHFGSYNINQDKNVSYNTADHLRFIHIALVSWKITKDTKYIDWATNYAKEFANKLVLSDKDAPLAWDLDWKDCFSEDLISKKEKYIISSHHHHPDSPYKGYENLIASGVIFIFGELYLHTNEDIFYKASKIIIQNTIAIITKPYADTIANNLNYFRHTFSDFSYDGFVENLLNEIPDVSDKELMLSFPETERIRLTDIGNRKDMIYWYYLDDLKAIYYDEPPSSFFTLAYNVTGNLDYALRGLQHASRKLKIASSLLRLGYEHSDSGKFLSAIISGHGRNWGVGAVTGCYSPLLVGTDENLGNYNYILKFQTETLVKGCLPLVRHTQDNKTEIKIYNVTNSDHSLKFLYKGTKSEEVKISAGSVYENTFK